MCFFPSQHFLGKKIEGIVGQSEGRKATLVQSLVSLLTLPAPITAASAVPSVCSYSTEGIRLGCDASVSSTNPRSPENWAGSSEPGTQQAHSKRLWNGERMCDAQSGPLWENFHQTLVWTKASWGFPSSLKDVSPTCSGRPWCLVHGAGRCYHGHVQGHG